MGCGLWVRQRGRRVHRIWNSMYRIVLIEPFDSGPAAVIAEKYGIQRVLGIGQLSFGKTTRDTLNKSSKASAFTRRSCEGRNLGPQRFRFLRRQERQVGINTQVTDSFRSFLGFRPVPERRLPGHWAAQMRLPWGGAGGRLKWVAGWELV